MDTAHFQSTCQSVVDVSRKIVDVTVGAVSWTSYYFHGASYLYDKQSWLARLGNVAGIFSEMNSELAISRKDRYFFPMKKIEVFERETKLWKACIHHHSELTGQLPSDCFSDGSVRLLMNVMLGYCIIKICQHLEDMHSWMNQYFLHDKCLQNVPSSCRISPWILT